MRCLFLDYPRVSRRVAKTLPPCCIMCAHMARAPIVAWWSWRRDSPPLMVLLMVLRPMRILVLRDVQVLICMIIVMLLVLALHIYISTFRCST